MKKRQRRNLALIVFALAAALPVVLAGLAAIISEGGAYTQHVQAKLGNRLDMTVSLDSARTLSPTRTALAGVSVTPLSGKEPLAVLEEVEVERDAGTGAVSADVRKGVLRLGSEAARQQAAGALGRLMRKSDALDLACRVRDLTVHLPELDAPVAFKGDGQGLTFHADPSGTLSIRLGKAKAYLGDAILSVEGEAQLLPLGELAYRLTASRDASALLPELVALILGPVRARCVRSFDGFEVLAIDNNSVERTFRDGRVSLTLLPLYEDLALADSYNAVRASLPTFVVRDGRIARMELVIQHDVQQFGRSALSAMSPRLLRTVMYLATGDDVELPFDKERFAFNDLEIGVSLDGDGIALLGKVSPRQGEWIAFADDDVKPGALRLPGEPVALDEFVRRWQEARRRNHEGWPGETPEIAPVETINLFDLLHGLTGGGTRKTDEPHE